MTSIDASNQWEPSPTLVVVPYWKTTGIRGVDWSEMTSSYRDNQYERTISTRMRATSLHWRKSTTLTGALFSFGESMTLIGSTTLLTLAKLCRSQTKSVNVMSNFTTPSATRKAISRHFLHISKTKAKLSTFIDILHVHFTWSILSIKPIAFQ